MTEETKSTLDESTRNLFGPTRDLEDFVQYEPASSSNATCEVPGCDSEAVNEHLCDAHCPPRVRPGRLCRVCGGFTTETFAAGKPDGTTHPVCGPQCLVRLAGGWQ